jgi:hypothetical protein
MQKTMNYIIENGDDLIARGSVNADFIEAYGQMVLLDIIVEEFKEISLINKGN